MASLLDNPKPRWHLLTGPGGGTWQLDGPKPDNSLRFLLNPDERAGRLRQAWQRSRGRMAPSRGLFDIVAPVGQHELTDAEDVSKVQVLLHRAGFHDIEKTEGPTGLFGLPDDEAVKAFQKHNGLSVDGRLTPDGETMTGLRDRLTGPRGSPERAAADSDDRYSTLAARPWPQSPYSETYLDQIHKRESTVRGTGIGTGYGAANGKALGRYQMRPLALRDVGLRDRGGNWTGKWGIRSDLDFLRSPVAQEKAIAAYLRVLDREMSGTNPATGLKVYNFVTQEVEIDGRTVMLTSVRLKIE